jgi:hypothetical protein
MENNIMHDFPELNPFVLRNLLDLYFSEDGKVALDNIVKDQIKKERKKPNSVVKKPPPTEIITNVEVRKWEETDFEKRIEDAKSQVFKIISPDDVETVA